MFNVRTVTRTLVVASLAVAAAIGAGLAYGQAGFVGTSTVTVTGRVRVPEISAPSITPVAAVETSARRRMPASTAPARPTPTRRPDSGTAVSVPEPDTTGTPTHGTREPTAMSESSAPPQTTGPATE